MAPVKVGDYVQVSDREATSADAKSGLFYNHFRNLSGTVERVYDDNSVCVDVDLETLSEGIKERHTEIQEAAKNKWINGLSNEQRNRLTEADKQFKMSYKILVGAVDVAPARKGSKPKKEADAVKKSDTVVQPEEGEPAAKAKTKAEESESAAKRLTEDDLAAAEEAYLKSRQSNDGK